MRYGEGLLEEIRQRTDLVALVGRRVKLVRKGRMMWGCCPFHQEKSPSFKVENERRLYKCFGCGKSGDAFKWVMETENLTFDKAVEKLAKEVGVELNEQGPKGLDLASVPGKTVFVSYCHADEELKDELLTHLSVLRREELVSVWHDRMLIPGEHLDGAIEKQLAESDVILLLISASFLNSDYCAEQEMIRAFERHYQGSARVVTVILRHCQWMTMPIKPQGKLGDFVALPKDAKPVNSYEDRDVAWNQIVAELRRFLSDGPRPKEVNLDKPKLPAVGDDNGLLSRYLKGPVSEKRMLRPFLQSLVSVVQEAEAATAGRFFDGMAAGFRDLDSVLGGFRKSDLILIAGRPEMGGTSLVLNIVANTLRARREVIALKDAENASLPAIAVFSFDMSSEQVARRMLSSDTGIPLWKIAGGKFSESEWEKFVLAMQDYSSAPLLVAEGPMSVDQLCVEATRMKNEAEIKCIVVDGLQRLTAWSGDGDDIANCDRIVRRLKMLASELSLPVIVTSSLPTAVDIRKPPEPELADLSEYGAIERFSDVVLLLYREFQYLKGIEPDLDTADHAKWMEKAERAYAKAEVFVDKNRNGSTARVSLIFDESVGVFQDFSAISVADLHETEGR